jgi:hypothetical protein
MAVLPPPAARLLTALTAVTVDLVVVGMPEVPPAHAVRLPEEHWVPQEPLGFPATVVTAEPVARQPGLHRAMHSVVKVALEVLSVQALATVVEVVPVAQRPKRLSTAMQLAAQVVPAALCLVALAMVVSLVPVAPRLLVEWSEQQPVAQVEPEAQALHHSVEPAVRVAQHQQTLERALP